MKKYIIVLICLCLGATVFSQTNYFIYIENTTKLPFTIKYNNEEFKGTSHITLSKLKPGSHAFTFFIAGNKPFTITPFLQDEDLGFVLKNNNAVWELQNINTQLVLAETKPETIKPKEPEKENSIKAPETAPKTTEVEPPKADITAENPVVEKPKETTTVEMNKEQPKATAEMVDLVSPKLSNFKIRKAFENINKSGIDQIYIVPNRNKLDTVAIYIPAEAKISTPTPKQTQIQPKTETTATNIDSDNLLNPNCQATLSSQAEESLKNNLQQVNSEKQKLQVAIQTIAQYCITINQAKQLGNQFETDELRVDFFKSIKNNLTIPSLYKSLEDNIVSDKWKAVFKESITNQ